MQTCEIPDGNSAARQARDEWKNYFDNYCRERRGAPPQMTLEEYSERLTLTYVNLEFNPDLYEGG